MSKPGYTQAAIFAAGCFWGVEAAFREVKGVVGTTVGYTGGHAENPTYREVCTDTTGHAEAVRVEYDPEKVSYSALLDVFWANHDPTQMNRQGPDVGSQYRSVVFYSLPEEEKAAEASMKKLAEEKHFIRPIATTIEPAQTFYEAEEYHQQYLEKHGLAQCHF
ncbi:peptide-methionine (S)-S-oxide reductase MsrA [bacterium]|nr:peptide-methionine (S)-S-oxide reductase MsrA [bacterium]